MYKFIIREIIFVTFVFMSLGCADQKTDKIQNESTSNLILSQDNLTQSQSIQDSSIKTLKALQLRDDISKDYKTIKSSIKTEKRNLGHKKLSEDSLSTLFKRTLVHRIFPFWEGTAWSFEGHTAIPRKGEIACGYFVSTTLKDMGININRYRLAQQSPINEAKSLALNTSVIEINESSKEENISKINATLNEGIHFIGFDASHVGYILKEKGQLYLIHSNYIDYKGVEIETIETSEVFASYNTYYLVELSTNKKLVQSWIDGSELKIIQ